MEWENGLLNRRLFRLENAQALRRGREVAAVEREAQEIRAELIVARVSASDAAAIRSLQHAGFVTGDVGVTFARDLTTTAAHQSAMELRLASSSDVAALKALVVGMFVNSYYYSSGFFSPVEADRIHEAWITNCANGQRGERVLVASAGARLVGFVTCRPLGDGLGVIDLIGVEAGQVGRGIGKALLGRAMEVFADLGCRRVRVRTQVINVTAVNLYASSGFRLVEVDTTLIKSFVEETIA